MKTVLFLFSVIFISGLISCEKPEEVTEIKEYQGPLKEADDIELFYTELTQVKTHVKAPKVYEFQNLDREFPEGIFIEFYGETGKVNATLRADKAFFNKEENLWRGVGDVVIKNLEKGQQLNTEELFWKPDQEKIFTEKFVTIKEGEQVLYGTGLEAKQDFSSYYIKKVEGEFYLDEEESNDETPKLLERGEQ